MVGLGTDHGVKTVALLTDMSTPLGLTAGNAMEVRESVEVLAGGGPADVVELTIALAREMLDAAGLKDADPAKTLVDGSAMDVWRRMIAAQGGDPDAPSPSPASSTSSPPPPPASSPASTPTPSASPPGASAPAAPARKTPSRPAPASRSTPSRVTPSPPASPSSPCTRTPRRSTTTRWPPLRAASRSPRRARRSRRSRSCSTASPDAAGPVDGCPPGLLRPAVSVAAWARVHLRRCGRLASDAPGLGVSGEQTTAGTGFRASTGLDISWAGSSCLRCRHGPFRSATLDPYFMSSAYSQCTVCW